MHTGQRKRQKFLRAGPIIFFFNDAPGRRYTGRGRGSSSKCLTIIANGSRLSWAEISSIHSTRSACTQYATNSHLWVAIARKRSDTNPSRDGCSARNTCGVGRRENMVDINSGGAPGRIEESVSNKRHQWAHKCVRTSIIIIMGPLF